MNRPFHVSDTQVERAIHVVDASGAVELLEQAIDLAPQGRPRKLSLRTWLIGALLAIETAASFKATTIHRALTGMSIDKQWELGVCYPGRDGTKRSVSKAHCDYLAKTLAKRLADTDAAAKAFELTLTDEEKHRRRQLRQRALDRLLDASKVTTHDQGWFAVDGSSMWSWGRYRGKPRDEVDVRAREEVIDDTSEAALAELAARSQADDGSPSTAQPSSNDPKEHPDDLGSEASEEGDAEQRDTKRKKRRAARTYDYDAAVGSKTARLGGRESYFGYVIDAVVRVARPDGPPVPTVIERLLISPASTDVVAPTLSMIDALISSDVTISDLCVDRHYSFKQVERWADELRRRGINQHFDLRSNEQGFRDVDGMKLVAGRLHCPATPHELGVIQKPALGASREAWVEFHRKINERLSWAMDRDHRPDQTGRTRVICPALAGNRGCPLREDTIKVAKGASLPIVADPPDLETAPACCTNSSGKVTAREPLLRKHDQPHYWGTKAWESAYNQRVYVEGVFGSIKNGDTEGLRRGFTKYVGLPLVSLGVTLAAVITNIRHQRKHWHGRDDAPDHPLLAPEPENHGWRFLTAEERATLDEKHTSGSCEA